MRVSKRQIIFEQLGCMIRSIACCAMALIFCCSTEGFAQTDGIDVARGDQIKAAFLYYVMKFADWNEKDEISSSVYSVCIVGDGGVTEKAQLVLVGKRIHGRRLNIKSFKDIDQKTEPLLLSCQGVFFGAEVLPSQRLLRSLAENNALTVGENKRFLDRGGMVYIFEDENRIKFDVSLFAVGESELRISSDMLQLARFIRGKGEAP